VHNRVGIPPGIDPRAEEVAQVVASITRLHRHEDEDRAG
jgi:hypothetical protein